MLYGTIRVIIGTLVFLLIFTLIRKLRIKHKRQWTIIAIIISLILTSILYIVPFENMIFTFSSPEIAYRYSHNGNITLIVNGKETDLIIGKEDDVDTYAIFPKTDAGWKIGTGLSIQQSKSIVFKDFSIKILHYRNSEEYYIMVNNTSGLPLSISDSSNSIFYSDSSNNINNSHCTYYAYITNFSDQYQLTLNNQTIKIINSL